MPTDGVISVSEGTGGRTTKVTGVLVPPAVVTVTSRGAPERPAAMTKLAESDVELFTVRPLTVTSLPLTATDVPPAMKLVPVSVTATVVPRVPEAGATLASVGGGGLTV